jgi:hypothetical protein
MKRINSARNVQSPSSGECEIVWPLDLRLYDINTYSPRAIDCTKEERDDN